MKILIAILFFLNFHLAKSQFSLTFPDSSAAWNYYTEGYDSGWGWWTSTNRYYINGDSTFFGHTYTKLYNGSFNISDTLSSALLIGFFRVDSSKVFFVNVNSEFSITPTGDSTEENLLYDFDIQVGDTFKFPNSAFSPPQFEIYIDSITTVNILGQSHRKFNYSVSNWNYFLSPESYWIEGIGSNQGFFTGIFHFESGTEFICFHEDGQDYSPNPLNGHSCANLSIQSVEGNEQFQLFPNPVNDFLYSNEEKLNDIQLFDLAGKVVLITQISKLNPINLKHLPNGFYSARIVSNNELNRIKILVNH